MKVANNIPQKPSHADEGLVIHDSAPSDLVKGMSHELRTPLNVIIGICQFLERDRKTPLSALHRDAVDRMERNARSLLHSVNHLLDQLRNGQLH